MMLEADVILGQLINSTTKNTIPIMGHPPATLSDLSLEEFLQEVLNFNSRTTTIQKRGVKLDFKTIEAFEESTKVLMQIYSMVCTDSLRFLRRWFYILKYIFGFKFFGLWTRKSS